MAVLHLGDCMRIMTGAGAFAAGLFIALFSGTAGASVVKLAPSDFVAGSSVVCNTSTSICSGNHKAGTVGDPDFLENPGNVAVSAVVGKQLLEVSKIDVPNGSNGSTILNNGLFTVDFGNNTKNGTMTYDFTGTGLMATHVALKGGPNFVLLKIIADMLGDGFKGSFTFDLGALGLRNNGGQVPGLSNIAFYGMDAPEVPLPGAIWLMGAGLAGVSAASRRKKNA